MCPFTKRNVTDRQVQNPRKYDLKDPVTDALIATYNLVPNPGHITDPGTFINKAYLDPIENVLTELIGTYAVNLYVNGTTGNDANDGLSAGTALKTIMAAVAKIPKILYQAVTINIAAGTYAEVISLYNRSGGTVEFKGSTGVATDVKINYFDVQNRTGRTILNNVEVIGQASTAIFLVNAGNVAFYNVKNTTAGALYGLAAYYSTEVWVDSACVFSNRLIGCIAHDGSRITISNATGSNNTYGIWAANGGTVCVGGTYPTGTTNSFIQEAGGQINFDGVLKWNGWRIYSSLDELGLSGTPNRETIANAMVDKSVLSFISPPNTDFYFDGYVQITVLRFNPYNIDITVSTTDPTIGSIRRASCKVNLGYPRPTSPTPWNEEYGSGNYDVDKPIYGNYTITDADHGRNLCQVNQDANNYTITIPDLTTLRLGFKCTYTERWVGDGVSAFAPAGATQIYSHPDNTKRRTNGKSSVVTISRMLTGSTTCVIAGNLKV